VPEGLSASEVGRDIGHHKDHSGANGPADRRDRTLAVIEALLLSLAVVQLLGLPGPPGGL
jgi:hypothetical protein